jgi:serine/threonine-protein kinase
MTGAALLARHNLRSGRGDRKGAFRLASFVFVLSMLAWLFGAHHVPSLMDEFNIFLINLSEWLLFSGMLWLIYIALEPYVRRRWPGRIIGWSRLLAGDWRDPLVGRDILLGALAGCSLVLLAFAQRLAAPWLGLAPAKPEDIVLYGLSGMENAFTLVSAQTLNSLFFAAMLMFLLLLLTIVTRRERVAAALLGVLVASFFIGGGNLALDAAVGVTCAAVTLFVLLRFGMLALVFMEFFLLFFSFYPVTTDFTAWYAGTADFAAALGAALILYGLKTSLAGQPLFRGPLLRD